MAHQQRFCPLCNRAFNEGEAVLRCEGCEVLHHPGCWVKNGGCATPSEHRVAPIALAYQQNAAPIAPTSSGAPDLSDATDADDPAPALAAGVAVIGAGATGRPPPAGGDVLASGRVIHRGEPLPTHVDPPTPPRRYVPAPPGPASGARPMPRIYRRNRLLGYWYFPAAALLAVGIAFGVIWLFDRISESDEPGDAVVTTPGVEGSPRAQTSPTAAATRAAGATTPAAGSTPADKFRAGDAVVVTGTGDCLNVRVAAGRTNDAIVCLNDGEVVTVSGGPVAADGFNWWQVKTALGEGWAAEEYLSKRP